MRISKKLNSFKLLFANKMILINFCKCISFWFDGIRVIANINHLIGPDIVPNWNNQVNCFCAKFLKNKNFFSLKRITFSVNWVQYQWTTNDRNSIECQQPSANRQHIRKKKNISKLTVNSAKHKSLTLFWHLHKLAIGSMFAKSRYGLIWPFLYSIVVRKIRKKLLNAMWKMNKKQQEWKEFLKVCVRIVDIFNV